jgi:hypothetical protein
MSKRFFARAWVLALVVAFGAALCNAEETVSLEGLTPGNWYRVGLERGGVKEDGFGKLLRADDEWLVFALAFQGKNEQGAPNAPNQVDAKRLYKNVGVGAEGYTVFVPREAVTSIVSAEPPAKDLTEGVDAPLPQVRDCIDLCYCEAKKLERVSGEVTRFDDEGITVLRKVRSSRSSEIPYLSDLPLIGDWFTRQTVVEEKRAETIDREQLLSMSVPRAFFDRVVSPEADD